MKAYLSHLDSLPKPRFSGSLSKDEIRSLLKTHPAFASAQITLRDYSYTTYGLGSLSKFLDSQGVAQLDYRPETFDCDDFSRTAIVLERLWVRKCCPTKHTTAFGEIIGDLRFNHPGVAHPHMMCIFIDTERKIWLVEPQKNQAVPIERLAKSSRITTVIM